MIKIDIDKAQWDRILQLFKELPRDIGRNALRAAIKSSSERTLAQCRTELFMRGGVRTGRLAAAIRNRVKSQTYNDTFFKATVGVPMGKKRDDETGAYYARFVEFGHAIVDRSNRVHGHVPAVPFLSMGLENSSKANIAEFAKNVKIELEKRVNRLPKAKRVTVSI